MYVFSARGELFPDLTPRLTANERRGDHKNILFHVIGACDDEGRPPPPAVEIREYVLQYVLVSPEQNENATNILLSRNHRAGAMKITALPDKIKNILRIYISWRFLVL